MRLEDQIIIKYSVWNQVRQRKRLRHPISNWPRSSIQTWTQMTLLVYNLRKFPKPIKCLLMTCSDLPTISSKGSVDKVVPQVTSLTTTHTRSGVDTLRFSVMMKRKTRRNTPTSFARTQDSIRGQCPGSKSGSISKVSNSSGVIKTRRKSTKVEANTVQKRSSRRRHLMNSTSILTSKDKLKRLVLRVTIQRALTIELKSRFLSKKQLRAPKLKLRWISE